MFVPSKLIKIPKKLFEHKKHFMQDLWKKAFLILRTVISTLGSIIFWHFAHGFGSLRSSGVELI
jgi:hypothetical protein